jgi:hypothetical protein
MKLFEKRNVLLSVSALAVAALLATTTISKDEKHTTLERCNNPAYNHVCIMKTVFGLDTSDFGDWKGDFKTPEKVEASIKKGLEWMSKAQGNDGGWGAGNHSNQGVIGSTCGTKRSCYHRIDR